MPIVELNNSLSTFYESSGTGIPIVFIHPPHMGHTVFKYQQELSDRFQVITYDIRGHGRSDHRDDELTIPVLTKDLANFLDAIEIKKAVIVGYSAGGSIAQEFALTYRERVKALVLSGGFPEISTIIAKLQYQFGMSLVRNGRSKLLSKLLAFSHKVTKKDQQELFHECLQAQPRSAYDYYQTSRYYNCTERLHHLQCPLLLVYGKFSHFRPYLKLYERHVPQSRNVLVSKSLHQVPIKRHHAFNHALINFMKNIR